MKKTTEIITCDQCGTLIPTTGDPEEDYNLYYECYVSHDRNFIVSIGPCDQDLCQKCLHNVLVEACGNAPWISMEPNEKLLPVVAEKEVDYNVAPRWEDIFNACTKSHIHQAQMEASVCRREELRYFTVLRLQHGVGAKTLAGLVGISRTSLREYERQPGCTNPGPRYAEKIARFFSPIPMTILFSWVPNPYYASRHIDNVVVLPVVSPAPLKVDSQPPDLEEHLNRLNALAQQAR